MALLLIISLLAVPVQAAGATVTTSSASVDPGDELAVTVSLDGNPGITVMRLRITYDRSVLTLTKVEDGSKLGSPLHSDETDSFPYVLYWKNSTAKTNYTDNGVIATLHFKVAEDALKTESLIEINVDGTDVLNADLDKVEVQAVSGTVKVSCSHSRTAWKTTTPSTCTIAGEEVLTCEGCGKQTDMRKAALAPHQADWVIDQEATTQKTGLRHGDCTVCKQSVEEVIPKRVTEITVQTEDGATVTVSTRDSFPGDAVLTVRNNLHTLTGGQVIAWNEAIARLAPGKEMTALYYMELTHEGEPYHTVDAMAVSIVPPPTLREQYGEWQWMFDNTLIETVIDEDGRISFGTLSLKNSYALVARSADGGSIWLVIVVAAVAVAAITIAILLICKHKHTKRERTRE